MYGYFPSTLPVMRCTRHRAWGSMGEHGCVGISGGGRSRTLLPWQLVRVSGVSMVPTLQDGDRVVVRHGAAVKPGDVVLARFRALPQLLVLKRVGRPEAGGWWLLSDNEFAGGDSRSHGVADVAGRVVLRFTRGAGVWRSPTRMRRGPTAWETGRPG
jgi:hypothetical protein